MSYLRIKKFQKPKQQKQAIKIVDTQYKLQERLTSESKHAILVAQIRYFENELMWSYHADQN